MKKQLSTIILLLMLVVAASLMMCVAASAEIVEGVDGDLTWTFDAETGTLDISGNGAMSGSALPWLAYRSDIRSLTVNEGVTSLAYGAFKDCTALAEVSLPNTLVTMGQHAFKGCASLCEIKLPEGLIVIDAQVFAGCGALTKVELPDTLTEIKSMAFDKCISLTDIKLPESLCELYTNAFSGCDGLLQTVGGLMYVDNWLVGYDKASIGTNIIVREGTVGIASSAFKGVSNILSVYIPRELVYVGNSAFEGCGALTTVRIEDGSKLVVIGDKAFYGCSKLASISLVKKAGDTNEGNFELPIIPTEEEIGGGFVVLPETLTDIGVGAFEGCTKIKTVVIPAGVTVLAERVFRGCTALKTLTLPALTKIGKQALFGCAALDTLYFLGDAAKFDNVEKADGWNGGADKYTLELHTEHEGGKATCAKSARCTVCGQWYGEKNTALHGETELVGVVTATCGDVGYTGDYCCVDCGDVLTPGEEIPATGAHTGGKANCVNPAVCEVCGNSYGEVDKTTHTGKTKIEDQKDETCGEAGYTGDLCCADCGELLVAGKEIPATGEHTGGTPDEDGNAICQVCGGTYKSYIRGDVNADKIVNANDAIHCLRHILFPAKFDVNQPVDFDGDGKEDANDAIYLLRHVLFPSKFPLLDGPAYNADVVLSAEMQKKLGGYIPNSWKTSIDNIMSDVPSDFMFAVQTDTHFSVKSGEQAGNSLKALSHFVPLSFYANLGDYIKGYYSGDVGKEENTPENTMQSLKELTSRYLDDANSSVLVTYGNHDANQLWCKYYGTADQQLTGADLYENVTSKIQAHNGVNMVTNGESNYYYVDFPKDNVRVIMLNTLDGNYESTFDNMIYISDAQFEWFESVALDTDKRVIIGAHVPFLDEFPGSSGQAPSLSGKIRAAVDAFEKAGGEFVAYLYGHNHLQEKMLDEYGNLHISFKNGGTTAEVVAINFDERHIYTFGLGSGVENREFDY